MSTVIPQTGLSDLGFAVTLYYFPNCFGASIFHHGSSRPRLACPGGHILSRSVAAGGVRFFQTAVPWRHNIVD
jgi:hypothetical protein